MVSRRSRRQGRPLLTPATAVVPLLRESADRFLSPGRRLPAPAFARRDDTLGVLADPPALTHSSPQRMRGRASDGCGAPCPVVASGNPARNAHGATIMSNLRFTRDQRETAFTESFSVAVADAPAAATFGRARLSSLLHVTQRTTAIDSRQRWCADRHRVTNSRKPATNAARTRRSHWPGVAMTPTRCDRQRHLPLVKADPSTSRRTTGVRTIRPRSGPRARWRAWPSARRPSVDPASAWPRRSRRRCHWGVRLADTRRYW